MLKIDVREEAAKRKLGLEACGRAVRYEFFRRLAGENGVIATAHTLSDLAETVLLHLTRGTGLKGLCGIPPVRENIVRPLIDCSRREIEDYCREHKIPYVTDSTNLEARYSRNKVRLQVLPGPEGDQSSLRGGRGPYGPGSLREDDGCLCEEARELLGRAALEKGGMELFCSFTGQKAGENPGDPSFAGRFQAGGPGIWRRSTGSYWPARGASACREGLDFHANRGVLRTVPHKKRENSPVNSQIVIQ